MKEISVVGKTIRIDGIETTIVDLAEMLNLNPHAVRAALGNRSRSQWAGWIEDGLWLTEHGYNRQSIYKRDGIWVVVPMIMEKAKISDQCARNRGQKWEARRISYEEMMAEITPKQRKRLQVSDKWSTIKLQPRKETWEITQSGRWEREQTTPQTFHHQGCQQFASEYTSQHYTGRTY